METGLAISGSRQSRELGWAPLTHLLVGQVFPAQFSLQALANLLSRDGFKIGALENIIDDVGVAAPLLGGHCSGGLVSRCDLEGRAARCPYTGYS